MLSLYILVGKLRESLVFLVKSRPFMHRLLHCEGGVTSCSPSTSKQVDIENNEGELDVDDVEFLTPDGW